MATFESLFAEAAEHARGYVVSEHIPCAVVAAANRERVLGVRAFGAGGEGEPLLAERSFALASITKAIVATGIARLVGDGKLDYTDPVARHLPEFGEVEWRRRITVGDIFTHSTGLTCVPLEALLTDPGARAELSRLFADEALYEPGTRFQYATLTYQILNALVLRLTGQCVSRFLQEYVFAPCGMTDTAFKPADARRGVLPVGHPASTPELLRRFGEWELSGAGLWSSAPDLVKLGQALLAPGKLLSPEGFRRLTDLQPPRPVHGGEGASRRTWGWCRDLGAFPRQPESGFYHGGATGTLFWIDPERDLIFVFLTNRWGSGNEHAFATLDILYR